MNDCFHANTHILCYDPIEKKEFFNKISNINVGDYIKTFGTNEKYSKVKSHKLRFSIQKKINKLVKCLDYNRITEERLESFHYHKKYNDIILTGGHALLYDDKELSHEKKNKMIDSIVKLNWLEYNYNLKVQDKNKLLVCLDENFSIYDKDKINKIHLLSIESDDDNKAYGLYLKHGLMAETCMEFTLTISPGLFNYKSK